MPLLPRSACSRDDSAVSRSATPSPLAQSRLQLRLWFLACLAAGPLAAATGRPNLLFILPEDQGAQLSFVGTPGLQTPHMDSLARTGVYFNRAYVAYPVCSASKAAIYTGLHNHANGILNNTLNYHKPAAKVTAAEREHVLYRTNRIRDAVPTLVERLHAAGYYQGVTSKLHVLPNESFPTTNSWAQAPPVPGWQNSSRVRGARANRGISSTISPRRTGPIPTATWRRFG